MSLFNMDIERDKGMQSMEDSLPSARGSIAAPSAPVRVCGQVRRGVWVYGCVRPSWDVDWTLGDAFAECGCVPRVSRACVFAVGAEFLSGFIFGRFGGKCLRFGGLFLGRGGFLSGFG